jgi:hypothetical protein
VNPIELEEFAVSFADLIFDVTIPEISSEAEGSIGVFVHGDVIRAFELNDAIAFGFIFVVSPGFGVLEQG